MRPCWTSMRSSRKCGGWYIAPPRSNSRALRLALVLGLAPILRLAPSLQRSPKPAVETEAIDRRRAGDGADAHQARARPLEAALFQNAPRRRIGDARRRLDRLVAEVGEDMIDQRAHRFGGVAFAPVLDAKPVADLRRMPVDLGEAAGADHGSIAQRDQEYGFGAEIGGGDEVVGVGEPV